MRGKTFYVKKSIIDLSELDLPSAGPKESVTRMRKKFWGRDCDIAIQGDYIYKLPPDYRAWLPV